MGRSSSCITLTLAFVASVSNQDIARKLEREQKKKKKKENGRGKGRGGEKRKRCFLLSPPPVPSFPSFCSRPNFLDELARKHLPRGYVNI